MQTLLERLQSQTSFLTVGETAALIRAHAVTVRDWIRAGVLPGIRVGNRWMVDPGDLARWLTARHTGI
jgi:excisionase family DNA binding protein